jgi:ATP-dependent helicase HrpB
VPLAPLPIDPYLPAVREALHRRRAVVVVATPGAGKTTRVPPAVADAGRVVVLQPRRVAARALARRIAEEQNWTLGQEVGWHVRFERRATSDTRVLIVTEGMLTHYLDEDPLLADVATVVLDEFHERSVHTDVGLALVADAWRARDDLRIVVMSATMDPRPVQAYLDDCPLVDVPGAVHPLEVTYRPGAAVADVVDALLPATRGNVLCFLPGAGEIDRAMRELAPLSERHEIEVLPLHGSLDADAQDRALQPGTTRRVIVATNIAETSLTVPGVSVVVDTGLQKVARYDAERAIDALVLERITDDSAAQRAGRAARLGPGLACRLWDSRDRLRPAREPEIHHVDLASVVLGLMAAGSGPEAFRWFEPPAPNRIEAARVLLSRLGAIDGASVTPLGHRLRQLPLSPRLGRVLLEGHGAFEAAAACALLSEPRSRQAAGPATSCDLLPVMDRWREVPAHTRRVAEMLQRLAGSLLGRQARAHIDEATLARALLAGYPDRVAKRRPDDPTRVVLASGRGAMMARESAVTDGEWLVALEVKAGRAGQADALVRVAARVEPEWLTPTDRAVEHHLDEAQGVVKAAVIERYDALTLSETPVAPDPETRARLLAQAWMRRAPEPQTVQLFRRAEFAGLALDVPALVAAAAASARRVADIDVLAMLPWDTARALDRDAPAMLEVPSGRSTRLTYEDGGSVTASVKLQELFGLADTPRLGPRKVPVVFELLAPNGRPVQTTSDLRSFWTRTYPEVRRELRGRYPKHPWPEDPWTATPTHRTLRRR